MNLEPGPLANASVMVVCPLDEGGTTGLGHQSDTPPNASLTPILEPVIVAGVF